MAATDPHADARNVFGEPMAVCSENPMTGFYRTGCCATGPDDLGLHVVCAEMTRDFLAYTQAQGNDLATPRPVAGFPGLRPGDRWCLCVGRWKEAYDAGVAPPVVLRATHEEALAVVSITVLKAYAVDVT